MRFSTISFKNELRVPLFTLLLDFLKYIFNQISHFVYNILSVLQKS